MATNEYNYENEVAAPQQNAGMPVKYKTKQYATKTNPSLLGLLGKNKTAFGELAAGAGVAGDVLGYMRPQQDPNQFMTDAHKRGVTQANTALSTGRGNANRVFGSASNIANTVGNKATQALLAQSANAGYGGGSAAAAVGSIGKDRAFSEASMNAIGMGAQMSNQTEQNGVQNQLALSQDTQLLDPGSPMDESVLAGVSALPSAMTDAKRGMVENDLNDRYDRYGTRGSKILTPDEQYQQDMMDKSVDASPTQTPMQAAQGRNPVQPNGGSAILNMVGKTNILDQMGVKKKPLDLTRPAKPAVDNSWREDLSSYGTKKPQFNMMG